jgi:hypothetical protein
MSFEIRETVAVCVLVGALLGGLSWISHLPPSAESSFPEAAFALSASDTVVAADTNQVVRKPGDDPSFSFDGHTFTVPEKGDPEWEDYQEMLKDPHVRTSVSNAPGFVIPYDPEWRSMITGHREVKKIDYPLTGYSDSLKDVAQEFLNGLHEVRPELLAEMRVDELEWTDLFWPEFPQSRPYLKIPVKEAWAFHDAEARSGANKALRQFAGRELTVEKITHGKPKKYCNFTLIGGIEIRALDMKSGELVDVPYLSMVAEREGRYKAYIFNENIQKKNSPSHTMGDPATVRPGNER